MITRSFKAILLTLSIFFALNAFAVTKTAIMKQEAAVVETGVQARASDPGTPASGQLWLNTTSKVVKYFTGGITYLLNEINAILPSQGGNSGKVLGTNGSSVSWVTAAGGFVPAVFKDKKAFNVNGGTSTSLTWTQHDLTVNETSGLQSFATLSANQVTLAAGTYYISASAAFYLSSSCKLRLYNVTDSAVLTEGGTDTYGPNVAGGDQMTNIMVGAFTIAGSKLTELEYWCGAGTGGSGLGVANNNSGLDNYYANLVIFKIL